jgi:CBS domain containing-hemolysin-like protein
MDDNLYSVFLVFVCICLEGLFSGGELALVASDINRIRLKAEAGSRSAKLAMRLLNKPEWFLATTSTGSNLCVVTSTVIATSMFISIFGAARGESVSAIVMIPLILMMGEIIPKTIFQQHSESVALKVSWFLWTASWIFYPAVFAVSMISRGAVYVLTGGGGGARSPYITRDGLKFLLTARKDTGNFGMSEKEMIRRILDFSEATAGRIMVPISNVTVLRENATLREAALLIEEKGVSRIPVYRDSPCNIIGVLYSFDLLKALHGQDEPFGDAQIKSCFRTRVHYVQEAKPASELLLELQRSGEQITIVVDESGGAVGIVTIEDILEEIVGEIEDEYDRREKSYKKVAPGKYLFDAQIRIEHLREIIPVRIPQGNYETLGGFLLHKMGKIPKRKETLRQDNVLFVIEDIDIRSIKEVMVVLPAD